MGGYVFACEDWLDREDEVKLSGTECGGRRDGVWGKSLNIVAIGVLRVD